MQFDVCILRGELWGATGGWSASVAAGTLSTGRQTASGTPSIQEQWSTSASPRLNLQDGVVAADPRVGRRADFEDRPAEVLAASSRSSPHYFGCPTPVPKGRRLVARGLSPWTTASSNDKAPKGRQTAAGMVGHRPPIRQAQAVGLCQPGLAPTLGVLSPRRGLAVLPFAFQGLAPLATNLGSSGAGIRHAHNHPNPCASASTHLNLRDGVVAADVPVCRRSAETLTSTLRPNLHFFGWPSSSRKFIGAWHGRCSTQ